MFFKRKERQRLCSTLPHDATKYRYGILFLRGKKDFVFSLIDVDDVIVVE